MISRNFIMDMSNVQIRNFLEKNRNLVPFPGLDPDYVTADALRDKLLTPKFFIYQKEGEIYYHPFHTYKIQSTNYFEIISAYGYGGPISTTNDKHFLTEVTNNYRSWCNENNIIVETIRFHPLAQNWHYYHGHVSFVRNTVFVDLQPANLLNTYVPSARGAIRKALKNNVTVNAVDPSTFLNIFPILYYDRMKELNARDFYFFNDDYFHNICELTSALRLIAVHEGKIIGAAIMLLQNNIMDYHLSAMTATAKHLRANHLILHEAFLHAQKNNFIFAHLGGGVKADHEDPLFKFKLNFAGKLAEYRIGKYVHNIPVYENLIDQKLLQER